MTEIAPADDIVAAVAAFGERPRNIVPLHPTAAPTRPRASFRVEVEAGHSIKARRMESEAAAARQQELRAGLPAAFAPVLARLGAILIEGWIEGRPLDTVAASLPLIRQAGALLAALHALPGAAGKPLLFRAEVTGLRDDTLSALAALADAGALDEATAGALATIVAATAPGDSRHSLIHTDFCAENLVVDAAGRLFVVDNEHFRFGPPGMDLARTWYRSGWHDGNRFAGEWAAFRRSYEAAGGDREAFLHEPFWRIAAATVSARLRLRTGDWDAAVPIACLVGLARSTASREERRA